MRASSKQLALKQETTAGVAQDTFDETDVYVRLREASTPSFDAERIESEEVQDGSEKRPADIGRVGMGFNAEYRLKGPGDKATDPAITFLWQAAMLVKERIKTITIGVPAGAGFVDGEIVTGGTSNGTGKVFRDTTVAGELRYVVVSGVLETGEVLTGSIGADTASTTSGPTDDGCIFYPGDSDFEAGSPDHHITYEFYLDGRTWTSRGSLGELSLAFTNGQPVVCTQEFLGVLHANADRSLIANVVYPEEAVVPPRWFNSNLRFGAYLPRDIREMTLNLPINLSLREDANDTNDNGVRFADYRKDHPNVSIAPGLVKEATFDYMVQHKAGTTFPMTWTLGSVLGSIYDFYADEAQFTSVGVDSVEDLATVPLEIEFSGTIDKPSWICHQH